MRWQDAGSPPIQRRPSCITWAPARCWWARRPLRSPTRHSDLSGLGHQHLDADTATGSGYTAQRWGIESWFADVKGLLGLEHYRLTSVESRRAGFWHLVACCFLYLDEVRAGLVAQGGPSLALGDQPGSQQRVQHRLLLEWLHHQFVQGHSVEHVEALLAA